MNHAAALITRVQLMYAWVRRKSFSDQKHRSHRPRIHPQAGRVLITTRESHTVDPVELRKRLIYFSYPSQQASPSLRRIADGDIKSGLRLCWTHTCGDTRICSPYRIAIGVAQGPDCPQHHRQQQQRQQRAVGGGASARAAAAAAAAAGPIASWSACWPPPPLPFTSRS